MAESRSCARLISSFHWPNRLRSFILRSVSRNSSAPPSELIALPLNSATISRLLSVAKANRNSLHSVIEKPSPFSDQTFVTTYVYARWDGFLLNHL